MDKILIIASIKRSETDGIFKKVTSQAKAFSNHSKQCELFCLGQKNIVRMVFVDGFLIKLEECKDSDLKVNDNSAFMYFVQTLNLLKITRRNISLKEIKLVYIRHMIPSIRLLKFMSDLKKSKTKVIYELPTYPYFLEQFRVSTNKLKAFIKLSIDFAFWPFIYSYLDVLSVIFCNTKAIKFSKMFSMNNGIESLDLLKKNDGIRNLKLSTFEIIGVGTVFPYHGYERILLSLSNCKGFLLNGKKIIFHIVGESDEIEKLRILSREIGIDQSVKFHGSQFGKSLDNIFENCLLGIGTLKLSIRNANIDTALKNIEYLGRNLPVVTSGKVFDFNDDNSIYRIITEDEDINFEDLYSFSESFYKEGNYKMIKDQIVNFEWEKIIYNLLNHIYGSNK